jgi:hypothetical protein
MPDNDVSPGMLEDFLKRCIPEDDPLIARAEACVEEALQILDGPPPIKGRLTRAKRPKAVMHTWLAWQKEPGTALGQAITKYYIEAGRPTSTCSSIG